MREQGRLIVDVSSVVKTALYAGKDAENGRVVEFMGRKVQCNSGQYGYDNAINSITAAFRNTNLTPSDTILVVESGNSKIRRKQIYAGYKESREKHPELLNQAFERAREMFVSALLKLGATSVTQPHIEADDVIAYLVQKLEGTKIVMSNDGDLATLLGEGQTLLYRQGELVYQNPYGNFDPKFIPLMKSLVGDGDEFKGAVGFGERAWNALLEEYGKYLHNLENMIKTRRLHELEDDIPDFKPFRKVFDGRAHVYESYACACLHPEWVNPKHNPLQITKPSAGEVQDYRLREYKADGVQHKDVEDLQHRAYRHNPDAKMIVFDSEVIGKNEPVFLTCAKILETGETFSFWGHVHGDMYRLKQMFARDDLTWISFNGMNFDVPINSLAVSGATESNSLTVDAVKKIKLMCEEIIERNAKPWSLPREFGYEPLIFDHIDLCETAPGVRISLKAYAARLGYPSMVDMPFNHDHDLEDDELEVVEAYCINDLGVTEALFNVLKTEIDLRVQMGTEYDIDLRSKSDAQVAEAVLRKVIGINGKVERSIPRRVRYTLPSFIQTDSSFINDLIEKLTQHEFKINFANGSPEAPDFLDQPFQFGHGTYKVGMGGLHSTHDRNLFREESAFRSISDIDAVSYYPSTMLSAGIIPSFNGDTHLGEKFLQTYNSFYMSRLEAKRARMTAVANTLKIVLNGTFGKLGSPYSAFYDPALMLGVTLTGQLNLLCLIYELEKLPGVIVLSANTDGIMVSYGNKQREDVLAVISRNAMRTGFEYEETPYSKIAMKDVNNYIAITAGKEAAVIKPSGEIEISMQKANKVKRKGLYASNRQELNPLFLMKNPTMEVCTLMAIDYLMSGVEPEESIKNYSEMRDFVAVRSVKGGGVQPESSREVDDWVLLIDNGDKTNWWSRQKWIDDPAVDEFKTGTMRKSRPAPVTEYYGGVPFGRLARWYMSTAGLPPLMYCGSGGKVPKTEGARVCMTLQDRLPDDLDYRWYINETRCILTDLGVLKGVQNADTNVESD